MSWTMSKRLLFNLFVIAFFHVRKYKQDSCKSSESELVLSYGTLFFFFITFFQAPARPVSIHSRNDTAPPPQLDSHFPFPRIPRSTFRVCADHE